MTCWPPCTLRRSRRRNALWYRVIIVSPLAIGDFDGMPRQTQKCGSPFLNSRQTTRHLTCCHQQWGVYAKHDFSWCD